MSIPLTRVYRGGHVESVHSGSIVVVDALGRILAFAGDPAHRTCLRSAAKPFQALPLLEYGGLEEFDLSGEEIALTCASHGGEPVHIATAAALLRKGEFDETDLLCGAHEPFDEKAAADLRSSGEPPSPLHNNCSGKHAGMLLASQVMDAPASGYIDAAHPVQTLARSILAEFSGIPAEEIDSGIDGCGVPAFFLSIYRAARAYARLMASAEGAAAPGALPQYAESAACVVDAMTAFPQYVAGAWSITTPLIDAFGGDLLAKEGAEGFYAMGLSPALAATLPGGHADVAAGIVLKVDDGSMSRGRNPAILRLLGVLGLEPCSRGDLGRFREWPLTNVAGTLVGEVKSDFELELV